MIGFYAAGAMGQGGGGGSDPYWSDVVLCINGTGSHGSTAYYDAKGHAVSNGGSSVQINVDADFPSGGLRITGSIGAYLFIADSSDFDFAGDFTIEFDHKPVVRGSTNAMLSMYNAYGANGGMAFFDAHSGSSGNTVAAINGSFPNLATPQQSAGVKRCYRYVRSGTTLSLYINDVLIGSQTRTGTLNSVGGIWIGTNGDGPGIYYSNCMMGRIRITRAARTDLQGTAPFPEA